MKEGVNNQFGPKFKCNLMGRMKYQMESKIGHFSEAGEGKIYTAGTGTPQFREN